MHKTTILCQFGLIICHQLPNHISINSQPFWWELYHGFTSNIAIHPQNETQPPPEYHEALVNLATSAATDHELITTLATTVANINDHIQKLNKAPVASVHNSETTNSTALSSITSSVSDLQQQLADLKREN